MRDLILDTNVLGDFLVQFFDGSIANRGQGKFVEGRYLSLEAAQEINRITRSYHNRGEITGGIVVISSFAFIELFRKWDQITGGLVDLDRLRGLLIQLPDWLRVAPVDEDIIPYFLEVPTHVYLDGFKALDWTDSVHVATALAMGDGHLIATTDETIACVNLSARVKCI